MKNMEVNIEKLDHYGKGIARNNGIPIFIDGALPNETVKIDIIKEKKKFCEAKTVEIISKNPNRAEPKCPYYKECGGCNIMHMNYPQQLEFKENKVKEVLNKFTGFENVKNIISTDQFYYRNKVTLKVKQDIGYYKEKSYEIVSIENCLIADEKINNIISKIKEIKLEDVTEIVIRTSKTENMAVFYGGKDIYVDIDKLDIIDNIIFINDNVNIKKGKGYIEEDINGIKFVISPTSFFQVNTNGMINLYNKVLEYAKLKGTENLLDLYCGTGTIGIYLAKYCKKVFGIEINKEAIKDAIKNKELNNLDNINFQAGDVKDVLKKNNFVPDIIVVDPPRAGLDAKVIEEIKSLTPDKLIYVSCDVVTLARDLKLLNDNFNIIECTPVDMFPNTHHVENVVLLEKNRME